MVYRNMWECLRSIALSAMVGLTVPSLVFAQTATLLPDANQRYLNDTGQPVANGQVFYYIPNTTTKKTIWQDSGQVTPQANPVQLDAGGKPLPAGQTYGNGCYQQVVQDQNSIQIWSAVTCSTGSGGGTSPAFSEGVMVGTIIPWANTTLPAKYLYTAGQAVSRTTYSNLFTALTFNVTILCTSGIATVSVPTDVSDKVPIGAPVEFSCFAPGTVVNSKNTGQLTLSTNATTTASVNGNIFPWGNGDGSTTFNIPDLRGRIIFGRNNMNSSVGSALSSTYYLNGSTPVNPNALNAVAGNQSHSQIPTEIAAHSHQVFLKDNGHTHGLTQLLGATVLTTAGGAEGFGGGSGAHNNITAGVSVNSANANITIGSVNGVANDNLTAVTGNGLPFTIINPGVTSDYIIKVLPDDLPAGPGVTSIQGMTGIINCGTGITCTANVISVNVGALTVVQSLGGMSGILGCGTGINCSSSTVSINQAFSPTWTGLHTFTTTAGGIATAGNANQTGTYLGPSQKFANVFNTTAAQAGPNQPETNSVFNLTSSTGSGDPVNSYKTALGATATCSNGSADCWAQSNIMQINASNTRGGIALELDLNNFQGNRTGAPATPYVANLFLSGQNTNGSTGGYSTCAICIQFAQNNNAMWNFGIVAGPAGFKVFNTAFIEDDSNGPTSIKIAGSHTTGIDLSLGSFTNAIQSPAFSINGTGAISTGSPGVSNGQVNFNGITSGAVSIVAQAVAGTTTLTLPNTSGTIPSTVTNETNVTLSLNTTTGLITPGWTGTLTSGRLNSNVVQGVTNDTNVTGSIAAQNLTLGWTGNLAVSRGGTGLGTLTSNAIYKGNGTSAIAVSSLTDDGTTFAVNTNKLTVTEASGNTAIAGTLALKGCTIGNSIECLINSAGSSGNMGLALAVTQTTSNASDLLDSALQMDYTLSASSATNELVARIMKFQVTNTLTGGGAISNMRAIDLITNTSTSTTTTNLDSLYLEAGSTNGTVTTGRAIHISSIQGTTKWGIADDSGSNWYLNGFVQTIGVAFSSLPTCNASSKGARHFVTDSNTVVFNANVAGGGANNIGVTCNGGAWVVG